MIDIEIHPSDSESLSPSMPYIKELLSDYLAYIQIWTKKDYLRLIQMIHLALDLAVSCGTN